MFGGHTLHSHTQTPTITQTPTPEGMEISFLGFTLIYTFEEQGTKTPPGKAVDYYLYAYIKYLYMVLLKKKTI